MMRDAITVMWKESREIFAMGGAYRGRLQLVILLGMMGVVLPLQAGVGWITSPTTIGIWGWLPVVLVPLASGVVRFTPSPRTLPGVVWPSLVDW